MWRFAFRVRSDEAEHRFSALGLATVAGVHAALLYALGLADFAPVPPPAPPIMVRVIPPEPPKPAQTAPPAPDPVAPSPPPKPKEKPRPVVQPPSPKPPKPKEMPKPVARRPEPEPAPEPRRLAAPAETPVPAKAEVPAAAPTAAAPAAAPKAAAAGAASGRASGAPVSAPRFNADYLHNPAPAYPALSKRMGEEGKVVLRVYVEPNGHPGQVEVKVGSGSPRLDQAAESAVRRWKFVPARRGDEPVGAWVLVPIVFNLRG